MGFEQDVRDDVTRLLAMLNPGVCEDSEAFKHVLNALTQMAMLGTAPPSCRSKVCKKKEAVKSVLDI